MTDRERLLQILNVPIHPHLDVDPLEALALGFLTWSWFDAKRRNRDG